MNLNKIPEALEIFKLLNPNMEKVISTRFVGGCVRDIILKQDINDIDLATTFLPNEVVKILKNKNIEFIDVAAHFGVITAIVNSMKFEITTLRKDLLPDGRYAKIIFTDNWEVDARRRDFTMNAIYYSVNGVKKNENTFFDPFNGKEDLINGKINFISDPEISIKEDFVRALRYFRFFFLYSKYDHDPQVLNFIFNNKEHVKKLSNKRLEKELRKIMSIKNIKNILKQNKSTENFFNYIYPGFEKLIPNTN